MCAWAQLPHACKERGIQDRRISKVTKKANSTWTNSYAVQRGQLTYLGDLGGGFPGSVRLPHDSIGQRLIHLGGGRPSVDRWRTNTADKKKEKKVGQVRSGTVRDDDGLVGDA